MIRTVGWLLLSIVATMLITAATRADEKALQPTMQRIEIKGDDAWISPELGAIVTDESGVPTVMHVPQASTLPKEYQNSTLVAGDQILMVNGKKAKSAKNIRAIYEALKVGEELQLGIKRDGAMQIVSYKKADPEMLPKRQMVIKTDGGQDGANIIQTPNKKMIKLDPSAKNVTPVLDAGLILGEKDSKIVVLGLVGDVEKMYPGGMVKEGTIILSAQGKAMASAQEFAEAYGAVSVGDKFSFSIDHDGKEVQVAITKPEPTMRTIINKQ